MFWESMLAQFNTMLAENNPCAIGIHLALKMVQSASQWMRDSIAVKYCAGEINSLGLYFVIPALSLKLSSSQYQSFMSSYDLGNFTWKPSKYSLLHFNSTGLRWYRLWRLLGVKSPTIFPSSETTTIYLKSTCLAIHSNTSVVWKTIGLATIKCSLDLCSLSSSSLYT